MKTKFYLFTLAASLSFVACTNEELDVISNTEVQKADLIELADVNVTVGDVDSRIANGQWETTDEIGVGFVNWADASGTTTYTGTKRTSGKWANGTDGTLYANHRLFRTEGTWKFENVVYEGLHYAYYPLDAEHVTVKPLTAAVGTTQTAGSEADFEANGIFAITPMYDLVETEAGKAPVVAFDLKTISNRLKLNLEVANFASITDPIIVKSVKVVETSATPVKTFAQKAIVGNVPTAVYTNLLAWEGLADNHADKTAAKKAVAIAEDKKLTDAVFKAGVISALDYTASEAESMSTTVKNHAGFTSDASTYSVNVFSLPVKNVPGSLKVVVETNYGTVTIAPVTTLSTNAATKAIQQYNNEKLATLLNVLKGTHDTVKFTEFGKAASVSLKLNMAEKVLTEFNVNSNDEWNDAIRIASQSTGNLTINVKKTVTADISNLPASVKTITIASGKYLNVEGQFPQDVTISGSGYVRVLANKSLIIDGTIPAPVTVSMANLVNYGEITIGENGKMDVTNVMNHATLINKKSLIVDTFVNDYDQITTDNNNHICHGIVKNYATLEVTTSFNNKGSFYTIGASANINGTITNNGNAITEEGGSFVGISGGKMLATVNTPAQMDAAIKAQATQITVTGVVSMTEKLQVSTKIILASDAELYILGTNVGDGTSASTSLMNIDVKGVNTKISAKTLQYINVLNVTAGNDLTILTGSKLDVYKMSYDINSTVTNNGRGVVVANFTSNNGSWKGLAANKYTNNSGDDVALTSSILATL